MGGTIWKFSTTKKNGMEILWTLEPHTCSPTRAFIVGQLLQHAHQWCLPFRLNEYDRKKNSMHIYSNQLGIVLNFENPFNAYLCNVIQFLRWYENFQSNFILFIFNMCNKVLCRIDRWRISTTASRWLPDP